MSTHIVHKVPTLVVELSPSPTHLFEGSPITSLGLALRAVITMPLSSPPPMGATAAPTRLASQGLDPGTKDGWPCDTKTRRRSKPPEDTS
jgi:hypothetical protein